MRFVLLLVAAIIAIGVGFAVLQYSNKRVAVAANPAAVHAAEQPAVETVEVLVAKKPIELGTVIEPSMVDIQPWPENLVVDGFVINNKSAGVVGKVARSSFQTREPFMNSKLANPNDPSFLAAALPAGMRALTMASDAITGVAGYVYPGDRVDVLFTHNLPKEIYQAQLEAAANGGAHGKTSTDKPGVAEILVPNLRVLAVNVRQNSGKAETAASATPSSVTVEINEADAQKLRLAEKNGTLSLTLRSLKDEKNNEIPEPTMVENISAAQVEIPVSADSIKITRGVGKDSDAQPGAQGFPGALRSHAANGAMPDSAGNTKR